MSAIEIWNDIVLSYRNAPVKTGNHWHGEHARWYDQWVKHNNYAETIYPIFQPFVHGKVLEIGAGTGLFTQYLVRDAEQLDILEPSADMLDLLQQNLSNQQNLRLFKTTIEQFDFQGKKYDFVFAAHAFFNVLHIDCVLQNIFDHCDILGVLIGNGKPLDVFQEFHDKGLVDKDRACPPHHLDLIPVLNDSGFQYDLYPFQTVTKYFYQDEDELIEKTAIQCGIRTEQMPAYLHMILPHIRKDEKGVYLQGNREHICLIISKNQVDFHNPDPAK